MKPRACIGCGYVCEADCVDSDGQPYKGCGRGCRLLTLAEIGAKATVIEPCVDYPPAVQRLIDTARAFEATIAKECREYNSDIYNDEHEQMRMALINLDDQRSAKAKSDG